ncbi:MULTISPECIES: LysR family transcriptional regulator ArgP [unclassified Bosea (in: a-proteobacteria)]|uniref:LysR family transcriptional regulator ArgP n=1 Tax=unclassified Bosea (in: a-proteobacteria) TaxID=2653178 RepID=UPI000F750765|nr:MULTISPECIES: LysR family transcriptional regulator ArgP [unclassified Bosea (in: a-proteobacteria)]AZO76435.1 transcriptional regulator ArgP [Bosea sp. Tri-49]RXT26363.1 LysR family transcriptional regulator [Bosea sp. Tri-39]RXT31603.1 LysR family transcriptional regulator [Bosea sp. Tri-54]
MLDYPALQAVSLVVRTGSFEKAAQALNVTPSAVSQRVKHLEERLGTVLIIRGQPCTATERGEWLCRHMEQVGLLEGELMTRLPALAEPDQPQQRVTLRVAANADSLGTWFLRAVAAFAERCPHLLDIAVDDQEHTADWLRQGRVLAAVTALEKPIQGCRVIPLGSLRYLATASPDFMARHFADGVTVPALAQAPSLIFNQKDRLQSQWMELAFGKSPAHPVHWVPSTQGFVEASLLGIGWSANPELLVREHLAAGRLCELMPGTVLDTPLFWQVNRVAAERLSDLTRAVVETARRLLVNPRE